jgi:hypothetical protein
MDIRQAEMMEAIKKPCSAGRFCEGGRGDADHLQLPLAKLGLVEVQPMKGPVHRGEGGEAGDALLGSGGGGH